MGVRWTQDSVGDLTRICDYTEEQFGAAQARRAAIRIHEAAESAGEWPQRGRVGRAKGTREIAVPGMPFVIVYRVREGGVEILRILHGAQRWP